MQIAVQKNNLGVKIGTEVWSLLKKRRQNRFSINFNLLTESHVNKAITGRNNFFETVRGARMLRLVISLRASTLYIRKFGNIRTKRVICIIRNMQLMAI